VGIGYLIMLHKISEDFSPTRIYNFHIYIVTEGDWRRLHNKKVHNLYSLPSTIRMITSRRVRCAVHVAQMVEGQNINAYRILVEEPEVKIPLARPRYRWVDNIKMNLRERG
jgi:hypothetical protein